MLGADFENGLCKILQSLAEALFWFQCKCAEQLTNFADRLSMFLGRTLTTYQASTGSVILCREILCCLWGHVKDSIEPRLSMIYIRLAPNWFHSSDSHPPKCILYEKWYCKAFYASMEQSRKLLKCCRRISLFMYFYVQREWYCIA